MKGFFGKRRTKKDTSIIREEASDSELASELEKDMSVIADFVQLMYSPDLEKVQQIILSNPLALQHKNNDGWYPLHFACSKQQSESVIQLLVKEYPLALKQKDSYGWCPMHLACSNKQSDFVIRLLVKEYPLALQQRDNHGEYPLHMACRANLSITILQFLLQQWHNVQTKKNRNGELPLHIAEDAPIIGLLAKGIASKCFDRLKFELERCRPDFAEVQSIVSLETDLLNKPIGCYGRYVLHYACWKNAPLNIVIEFIDGNPLALHQEDLYGHYPLHLVCANNQAELIIQLLVNKYPLAAKQKNKYGYYPLHLALENNQTESVIQLLVKEYPLAIRQENINGNYPLHLACCFNQSKTVIQLLVNEHPLVVQQQNIGGNFPLHLAIQNNQSESVIQQLINEYPLAILKHNIYGNYPLHLACENGQSESIIQLLLKEYPLAVQQQNYFGYYPLHLALENNQPESVIQLLVEKYTLAVRKNTDGKYPLTLACCFNQSTNVIQLLIKEHPLAVKLKGDFNWYPLHFACSKEQSESAIQLLINEYPLALQQKDYCGSYPLHLACSNNQSDLAIQLLVNKYPLAVQQRDNDGEYPLHLACRAKSSLTLIQFLVAQWPNALTKQNYEGKSPLDLAKQPWGDRTPNKDTTHWLEDLVKNNNPPTVVKNTPTNLPYSSAQQTPVAENIATQNNTANNEKQTNTTSLNIEHDQKPTPTPTPSGAIKPDPTNKESDVGNNPDRKVGISPGTSTRNEQQQNDVFADIRSGLKPIMEGRTIEPISVSVDYVNAIKMDTILGEGCFGTVYKGFDNVLDKKFAIKVLNLNIMLGASPAVIKSMVKSFKDEAMILANLNHPNIATLYGYQLASIGERPDDISLVYDLADNGSLDTFWQSEYGRSRLSSGKTRLKIGFQVASALCYMHEGLDGNKKIFHRDVKSGNVCLTSQFDALLIDCGLAKLVEHIDDPDVRKNGSTANVPKGTPGYICPSYNNLETKQFISACDVFSFGVFLCEVITGQMNIRGTEMTHYVTYKKKSEKNKLIDSVDNFLDWDDNTKKLIVDLALKCMEAEPENRPKIHDIVSSIRSIYKTFEQSEPNITIEHETPNSHPSSSDSASKKQCSICGIECEKAIDCHNSKMSHTLCGKCLEDGLKNSLQLGIAHTFKCTKKGCSSNIFNDLDVMDLISPNLWQYYIIHTVTYRVIQEVVDTKKDVIQVVLDTKKNLVSLIDMSIRLQVKMGSKTGNKCPYLFLIEGADSTNAWKHPRETLKNIVSDKLYLYFVCSHSLTKVSDDKRIKLRVNKEWLKKIAPAWNMSLLILEGLVSSIGIRTDTTFARIKDINNWVKEQLLDPETCGILEFATQQSNNGIDSTVNDAILKVYGESFAVLAEKTSDEIAWTSELVEVYDFEKKKPTWVKKEYENHPRYTTSSSTNSGL